MQHDSVALEDAVPVFTSDTDITPLWSRAWRDAQTDAVTPTKVVPEGCTKSKRVAIQVRVSLATRSIPTMMP